MTGKWFKTLQARLMTRFWFKADVKLFNMLHWGIKERKAHPTPSILYILLASIIRSTVENVFSKIFTLLQQTSARLREVGFCAVNGLWVSICFPVPRHLRRGWNTSPPFRRHCVFSKNNQRSGVLSRGNRTAHSLVVCPTWVGDASKSGTRRRRRIRCEAGKTKIHFGHRHSRTRNLCHLLRIGLPAPWLVRRYPRGWLSGGGEWTTIEWKGWLCACVFCGVLFFSISLRYRAPFIEPC